MTDITTSPVEKLRAALKPFADRGKGLDPGWADDRRVVTLSIDWSELRVSDLRRAAEAYATLSQPGMAGWKETLEAIAQRCNESGSGPLGERETIYAVHELARNALSASPMAVERELSVSEQIAHDQGISFKEKKS